MTRTDLFWLPSHPHFSEALKECRKSGETLSQRIRQLQNLANHNLDFVQTANIYRTLKNLIASSKGETHDLPVIKLALLASSTMDHVMPAIHVAALRRGFILEYYSGSYNQYQQELLDASSGLYAFHPQVIMIVLHSGDVDTGLPLDTPSSVVADAINNKVEEWKHFWSLAKDRTGSKVVHSTIVAPPLQVFGQMDDLVAASPARIISQINTVLEQKASEEGVLILDLESIASRVGKYEWCNYPMWFHAKQAIPVAHSPLCGDYIARLVGAIQGFSKKCLVLDLDNTLWGGVIGDDGLENIVLGQGNAVGEAFQAFQIYLKQLKNRGVLLAVCSKNDELNAYLPFDLHPDMILHRDDFAIFISNWETKALNLERIASQLNIGIDSLVFFDDNSAERDQIRQFLPKVAVPEVPTDPADFTICLSEAGYFEAAGYTQEDRTRTDSYRTTVQQSQLKSSPRDLDAFLKGLNMELVAASFDDIGIQRIAQLINKSNQFNLTTRRYTEEQVKHFSKQSNVFTLQIRLKDRLSDHGMISVVIARPEEGTRSKTLYIDTWLMSCRVLGRQVEEAVLNLIVEYAEQESHEWVIGEYIETAKNSLVLEHYQRLGFAADGGDVHPGHSRWRLKVKGFSKHPTHIHVSTFESKLK